jgi:phenylpyruvate tautomerase PptA (4-oxalocrotonate tautomerase family)
MWCEVVVLRDWGGEPSFISTADLIGVVQMPLYTAFTQEGTVSIVTKARIAEEITRIHTTVMSVPKNFVRVVFLSYRSGLDLTM